MIPLRIPIRSQADTILIRKCTRELSKRLGFSANDQTSIATVSSELARNVVMYAGSGELDAHLDQVGPAGFLVVRVADRGPGIPRLQLEHILEGRPPSKKGLHGARLLMDDIDVQSIPEKGTTVTARKRLPERPTVDEQAWARIIEGLPRVTHDAALTEIADQNRSLIAALAELQSQQDELRRTNAELQAISSQKDLLLATVSHELRSPMTAILGWTKLLQMGLHADGLEDALTTIEQSARLQARLIDDLLDLSRFISRKLTIEPALINPAQAVHRAVESIRVAAEEQKIRLETEIEPCPLIVADAARLQQVLCNLLNNALRFTPENGTVSVSLQNLKSRVSFTVRDTGAGIEPDCIAGIFDSFRQAGHSTRSSYRGLGLGLAIARELVALHDGVITAESGGSGKGASFTFTIPTSAEGRVAAPIEPDFDMPRLTATRILIVDDEEPMLRLLALLLEKTGAEVVQANNARRALAEMTNGAIDLIVSDIGLPDQDGYWLIREIRSGQGGGRRIPAIALTAFAQPEDQQDAIAAGFDAYMSKPVDPIELILQLARMVERDKLSQASHS